MDDWADEKESLVSLSDEEKQSASNGDELQAGSNTSISTGEEKMAEGNGKREEGNGVASAATGIIDGVASKFGVVPGLPTGEEGAHKEEGSGGIINQLISNLPKSENEFPAAEEASLLISIIED